MNCFNSISWKNRGARSQRGVALILTLIMLAVITVVVVVFLATTSRNRVSTSVRVDQTVAEFAAENAAKHAEAKIIEPIIREKNLLGGDFLVSYPAQAILITTSGVPYHPPAYGYELDANNRIIRPRANDSIPHVVNSTNKVDIFTVDVFLDLNRNRRFDDPGNPTNRPYGDPIWIGVLDRPWFPHSRTNRFVARYAYLIQPVGKSLDLNTIHNDSSPNPGSGFMRNQGVGPWELNLGAFLHELDPVVWDYDYNARNGKPEDWGTSQADARSIVNYRHGWPGIGLPAGSPATYPDALTFSQAYFDSQLQNFPSGEFDIYSDGITKGAVFGLLHGQDISYLDDDNPLKPRWPGADTTNHFFHIQELFDKADVRSNKVTIDFYSNLIAAITREVAPGVTNDVYYRLLSQIGMQTGSDFNEKINLNWADKHAYAIGNFSPTNFIGWDSSPQLAVSFFTNVAERIFRAQSNEFNPTTNLVVRSILEIPVYPTNRYSSGIHRILQLAANIYDAANTNRYPSVFRPLFGPGPIPGVNYIVGYENDNRVSTLPNWLNNNTNGIPLVIGAKKGFPNFNEFTMWSEFLVSRKLEVTRLATNLPPNGTNLLYTLGITNRMGIELWNSYRAAYPRPLDITISNFTYGSLTNQYMPSPVYVKSSSHIVTTNIVANGWRGYNTALGPQAKLSFIVPTFPTNTFLSNVVYSFTSNTFLRIGLNQFENLPNFPAPDWYLTLSNRMNCLISERVGGTDLIVDFVLLNDSFNVDLSKALMSGTDPLGNQTPFGARGVWSTNRNRGLNGPTDGILKQIDISAGDPYSQVSQQDWKEFSTTAARSENDKIAAIRTFRDFLKLPALPASPGDPPLVLNNSLFMQAGFSPGAKMSVVSVWQANDPLVHYHSEDLRFEEPTNNYFRVSQPATNIAPATLGDLNTRYSPWLGRPLSSSYPESSDLHIKDPGVTSSDEWHFPSNKLATVGLLGRVHRGTPWQTVYVKAFETPFGQTDSWMAQSKDTALIIVSNNTRIVSRSHPTNDWKLLDMFTTSLDERTSTGLVSINQTNIETWSALLSGVLVLSNNAAAPALGDTTNRYAELLIEPSGGNNNAFFQIWTNIFRYQYYRLTNSGPLEGVGELIQNVPQLTTQSPFLNVGQYQQEQMLFGLDDFAFEQIPQQILSLLRIGNSRFVIYAYGQALKPEHIDASTGVVDNYQVAAEFGTRTVLRLEGDPRGRVRTVVESFNILPPD